MYTALVNAFSNFSVAFYVLHFTESCLVLLLLMLFLFLCIVVNRDILVVLADFGRCDDFCLFSVLSWFTSLLYILQPRRHSDSKIDHE
jgi:hypothetical protein